MAAADPVLFPGGVADPDGRAGYVEDGAGIIALRLRDGEPRWRTERATRPLISDGERLAAAVLPPPVPNVLEVVVLDAARGEPVVVCEPAALPEWVRVAPLDRAAFAMSPSLEGSRLRLEWEAHARYGGGAPPPPHVRREAERDAEGVLEIDLESGAVSPLPAARRENAGDAVRRPPLDAGDPTEPWLADSAAVRLVWDVNDGEQKLALETSASPAARGGALVELAHGEGLVAQVTRDGRHVFVHREPAPAGEPWLVFSARTGQRVVTLPHDPGARSPAILANRVYYLLEGPEPARALRARELQSGTLAWELPLAARRASPPPLRQ
jgi:hypothetical protein